MLGNPKKLIISMYRRNHVLGQITCGLPKVKKREKIIPWMFTSTGICGSLF